MAHLSNTIEAYILELLGERGGKLEIQRNLLAEQFACAPSQINYVLTTRFTPYKGYYVESRRGGGGYIRIVQVQLDQVDDLLASYQEEVGQEITKDRADQVLDSLEEGKLLSAREARLLQIALSDRSLEGAKSQKNHIRASILQNLLLAIFS
ncbi:MAG: CtsR family transcriptional regulator [Tissierellia bacterium]|nr:CtsR family transcriptional regulator [Tissierellia bacterium]